MSSPSAEKDVPSTPIFCDAGELWEAHDEACCSGCNYGLSPTQQEMAEGHLFEFTWQSWGVSRVVDDPTYTQADWSLPPHRVQVRAWSLKEALLKAAELPLKVWFPDE